MSDKFCIGIDFGTDSVRALLVNAENGEELATSVFEYPRWKRRLFCDPEINQFRQHPLDYLEGLKHTIREIIGKVPDSPGKIRGISVATTGSTPVAVNKDGVPLALLPGFQDDPDAMFILWKDHTALAEADRINALCRSWFVNYSRYSGGTYSAEWFWAKILYVLNRNEKVFDAAYSWVEHCDWIPALLTGIEDPLQLKRSRSAAGHKAMWHPEWNGLPSSQFLRTLHPKLEVLKDRLYTDTYTSNIPAGTLSREWAKEFGLRESVVVGVGAMDSHFGFVGGQIEPYTLSKVIGTSTVDMIIIPQQETGYSPIQGLCGQVNGSVVPGMISLEAGQSAFGDVYEWFRDILLWPIANGSHFESPSQVNDVKLNLIKWLSNAGVGISPDRSRVLAIDWFNGRRSPNANPHLKGAIMGLTIGTDAPKIFKGLVEATAYGSRKIMERFKEVEIPIREEVIAMGGVAQKSPLVMQTLADVMNMPIKVVCSEHPCALGAAMFAAVVAGIYKSIQVAQKRMGSGFDLHYIPIPGNVSVYQELYDKYERFSNFVECF